MATTSSTPTASDLFEQASRTFQSAVRSGIKLQEESTRWFTELIHQLGSPQEWQERTQAVMEDTIGLAQKNTEEAIRLMNQNAEAGMNLMRKALEAWQAESSSEAQSKTREAWEIALGAMHTNTEAIVQANTRNLERWADAAKRFNAEMAQKAAAMSKKSAEEA